MVTYQVRQFSRSHRLQWLNWIDLAPPFFVTDEHGNKVIREGFYMARNARYQMRQLARKREDGKAFGPHGKVISGG